MKLLYNLLFISILCLFSCTEDIEKEPEVSPGGDTSSNRREVLLTFQNKLKVDTKAGNDSIQTRAAGDNDLIATDAENEIASMDIYVFGSDKENGTYSFQEMLYYRSNGAIVDKPWATSFELFAKSANETNGLLPLKKGLFVKLYIIANKPGLVGEMSGADPAPITYEQFKALVMEGTGDKGRDVKEFGQPTEDDFKTFRTPLLQADKAEDVLQTPLTMVGAYLSPIDLTDFAVNTRLQVGFKLTRTAARFDIVNDAKASRFTVESISMAEGRSGVSYFPIKPYEAKAPLNDAKITYPLRPFKGAQTADDKLEKGAFYSYPSPKEDKAYLILNGTYNVNQTEKKAVTYQIPFKQIVDGTGNYIEVAYNHRYTIYISDADEYHLDVAIKVADWDEGGSIDDYQPDTAPDSLSVNIDVLNGVFDNKTKTVSLYLAPTNFFNITTASNAGIDMEYTYDKGDTQHDWLKIEKVSETPVETKALSGTILYDYRIAPNPDYKGNIFPRAKVVFRDKATTQEQFIYVQPYGKPEVHAIEKAAGDKNPNTFVDSTLVLTMHRAINSTLPLKVVCPSGSKVLGTLPTWLTVTKNEALSTATDYIYNVTIPDTTGTKDDTTYDLVFANASQDDLITTVKLQMTNGGIDHDWVAGNNNTWDEGQSLLTMPLIDGNKAQLNTTSVEGVKVDMDFGSGKPQWLKHDGEVFTRAGNDRKVLIFDLNNNYLVGASPVKVTITNNYQGDPYTFTVNPVAKEPIMPNSVASTMANNSYNYSSKTIEIYRLSDKASEVAIEVKSPGGSQVGAYTCDWLNVRKDSLKDYLTNRFTFSMPKGATAATDNATCKVSIQNMTDNSKAVELTVKSKLYPIPKVEQSTTTSKSSTLKGNDITIYRLSSGTTTFTINATALGGSKITYTGSGISLGNTTSTTGNNASYVLTATGAGKGTLRVMNNSDNTRYTDYNVTVMNAALTVNSQSVNAGNNAETNIPVTSGLGCTAAVTSWGGGSAWFSFKTSSVNGGTAQNIQIKQNSDLTNTIMKPATITLTNKISGEKAQTITVTPKFTSNPTLNTYSGKITDYYLNTAETTTFQITSPGGGADAKSSNPNVATVSRSGKTYKVTPKGLGSTTITVPNGSDTNLKTTYTIDISAKVKYEGKLVWKYSGYYIAPIDATDGTVWSETLTTDYCSNKTGTTWIVPSQADLRIIMGTVGEEGASSQIFNEYTSKGVFEYGHYYWSTTTKIDNAAIAHFLDFWNGSVRDLWKTSAIRIRCVSKE